MNLFLKMDYRSVKLINYILFNNMHVGIIVQQLQFLFDRLFALNSFFILSMSMNELLFIYIYIDHQ